MVATIGSPSRCLSDRSSTLNKIGAEWTVCGWMRLDTLPGTYGAACAMLTTPGAYTNSDILAVDSAGQPFTYADVGGTPEIFFSGRTLTVGRWYHIVFARIDNGTLALWVDEELWAFSAIDASSRLGLDPTFRLGETNSGFSDGLQASWWGVNINQTALNGAARAAARASTTGLEGHETASWVLTSSDAATVGSDLRDDSSSGAVTFDGVSLSPFEATAAARSLRMAQGAASVAVAAAASSSTSGPRVAAQAAVGIAASAQAITARSAAASSAVAVAAQSARTVAALAQAAAAVAVGAQGASRVAPQAQASSAVAIGAQGAIAVQTQAQAGAAVAVQASANHRAVTATVVASANGAYEVDVEFGAIKVRFGNVATWCRDILQPASAAGVQLLSYTFAVSGSGWSEINPPLRTPDVPGSGLVATGTYLQELDSFVCFFQRTGSPSTSNNDDALAVVVVPYAVDPSEEAVRVRPCAIGDPNTNATIAAHRAEQLLFNTTAVSTLPSIIDLDVLEPIAGWPSFGNARPDLANILSLWAGYCGELWANGYAAASQRPSLQSAGYGEYVSARTSEGMLMALSTEGTTADRTELARRITQVGVDMWGTWVLGRDDKVDGGHYQGCRATVVWAGHFLEKPWVDVDTTFGASKFHEPEQYYTASPAWVWGWPYGYLGNTDFPTNLLAAIADWGADFPTLLYLTGYFAPCLGTNIGQALAMKLLGRTAEMGVGHFGMVAQWMEGPSPADLAAIDAIVITAIDPRDGEIFDSGHPRDIPWGTSSSAIDGHQKFAQAAWIAYSDYGEVPAARTDPPRAQGAATVSDAAAAAATTRPTAGGSAAVSVVAASPGHRTQTRLEASATVSDPADRLAFGAATTDAPRASATATVAVSAAAQLLVGVTAAAAAAVAIVASGAAVTQTRQGSQSEQDGDAENVPARRLRLRSSTAWLRLRADESRLRLRSTSATLRIDMQTLHLNAVPLDIHVARNTTAPFDLVLVDSAGAALTIAGATFVLTVNSRENPEATGAVQQFQLTGSIVSGGDSRVRFAMTEGQADLAAGTYWYDVVMTASDTTERAIAKGRFVVHQNTTP